MRFGESKFKGEEEAERCNLSDSLTKEIKVKKFLKVTHLEIHHRRGEK